MTTRHTQEPWTVGQRPNTRDIFARGMLFSGMKTRPLHEAEADAERAVACVNACAGIPDPETTIPELVDALRECLEQHKGVYRYGLAPRSALSTIYEKARAVLAKLEGGQQG